MPIKHSKKLREIAHTLTYIPKSDGIAMSKSFSLGWCGITSDSLLKAANRIDKLEKKILENQLGQERAEKWLSPV